MASADQGSGRRRSTSLDVQASQGSGRAVHSLKPLEDDRLGGVSPKDGICWSCCVLRLLRCMGL